MKNLNLENVQEVQEFTKVAPDGYVCKITSVEDIADKEYLKIKFDIAEGEFKGYYQELYANKGFWAGKFIKSYKDTALSFFKSFITAVQNSNTGFVWNDDETKLIGKFVGLVLAEEEYQSNEGVIKTRLYVDRIRSVESIKKGDFKVPFLKIFEDSQPKSTFIEIGANEDLPF